MNKPTIYDTEKDVIKSGNTHDGIRTMYRYTFKLNFGYGIDMTVWNQIFNRSYKNRSTYYLNEQEYIATLNGISFSYHTELGDGSLQNHIEKVKEFISEYHEYYIQHIEQERLEKKNEAKKIAQEKSEWTALKNKLKY